MLKSEIQKFGGSQGPQGDLRSKCCIAKMLLESDFRGGLFFAKMPNSKKIPSSTHPFWSFEPLPKYQNFAPYLFSPSLEVSKKVCHVPVGQKLREEIYFQETGHVQPRAVPWRPADPRPLPKYYLYGVGLVLKISSRSFLSIKSYSQLFNLDRQRHRHTDKKDFVTL
jgi:hypothetical protein